MCIFYLVPCFSVGIVSDFEQFLVGLVNTKITKSVSVLFLVTMCVRVAEYFLPQNYTRDTTLCVLQPFRKGPVHQVIIL